MLMCVSRLINTCDMTHSQVGHDSFTCVTWLIHMCDMTHSITHSHVFPRDTQLSDDRILRKIWRILRGCNIVRILNRILKNVEWMCENIEECYRWRRLIGSPKLQIIFHQRATKYRALLRKMTYKDKGSYESSPPCKRICWQNIAKILRNTERIYSVLFPVKKRALLIYTSTAQIWVVWQLSKSFSGTRECLYTRRHRQKHTHTHTHTHRHAPNYL